MNLSTYRQEWFGNIRGDVLSGIVVALALIPEAIAFSIIAGVDPMVGLYASFCIAIIISFVGGRPGMISAATGSMALVMVDLVKDHGLNYLLAATILTGILQVILGVCKIGKLLKYIPKPVMTGFVNSLAILIFYAQLTHFTGATWVMYTMTAASLAIIYLFPRITTAIPSPLVAIIVMTIIAILTHADVRTVGDMGNLSQALPAFLIPDVPFNMETLQIIFPYAIALAFVGLLESLLTAQIVDEMTETDSNKNVEASGQGMANIINGFFGGMAGCAMIGQSGINIKSGGRGRLSSFVAGAFLMILIVLLHDVLVKIPMAALVAVMFMVSIGTFDWSSLKKLRMAPKTDAIVMIVTVIIVLYTNDLSKGVFVGVLLSMIFFSVKISKVQVKKAADTKGQTATYRIKGQIFFASVEDFVSKFDLNDQADCIVIDFSEARIWDASAVGAVDKVLLKYQVQGKTVEVLGLDPDSSKLLKRLATYDSKI